MQEIEKLLTETKQEMTKNLEHLVDEAKKIRVGKAEALNLYSVKVRCYGSVSNLNEVAQITTPEFNQFLISPYDANIIKDIIAGLNLFNSEFNPISDNRVIRITLPPITAELRQKNVKILHDLVEKSKIDIRNARHHSRDIINKHKELSKDAIYDYQEQLQKITNDFVNKINDIAKKREEIITKV